MRTQLQNLPMKAAYSDETFSKARKISHEFQEAFYPEIPVILESPVLPQSIKNEIQVASYLFNKKALLDLLAKAGISLENFNVDVKYMKASACYSGWSLT